MRRPLDVERALAGEAAGLQAAFAGDPGGWLPAPARWRGGERWSVRLAAGRLSRAVDCRVGGLWRVGDQCWRALAWDPVDRPGDALPVERVLPSFAGELGIVVSGAPALRLRGTYEPPAGALGAAVDAAALHRVAAATAGRFVEDVVAALAAAAEGPGRGGPSGPAGGQGRPGP